MTPQQLTRLTDHLCRWWQALAPGFVGALTHAEILRSDLLTHSDLNTSPQLVETLIKPVNTLVTQTQLGAYGSAQLNALLLSMNRLIRQSTGQRDIESLALHYNLNAPYWQALLHPVFQEVYQAYRAGAPPPLAYYGVKESQASWSHGSGFSSTPGLNESLYAGAFGVLVSNLSAGSTVTVRGKWRRPNGTILTNGDATVSVPSGSQTRWMPTGWTLPEPNLLLLEVSNLTVSGSPTGTVVVHLRGPEARHFA